MLVALAALAVGGCDASTDSSAPSTTANPAASGGAFPVTVEHKYGSTEIKAAPRRIVTLGLSDQDVVLALGVKPVGVVDWFKERPYGIWPWTKDLWGDTQPEIVGERDTYGNEKILGLQPDLIVAQYSGMNQEQYDTLSKIAPVVAQPKNAPDYQATWQDMTKAIGTAMGKATEVDALIAGIDKKFADARVAHPEFAGKSVVVADAYQPGTYSVFSPNDPKMLFMTELGFTVPAALTQAVGDQNVLDLSYERFDVVEADRLVWLATDPGSQAQIEGEALYQRLAVAKEGRDLFVPYAEPPIGASMAFNTVLSIPYALDQLVPQLAAGK